uniref:D-lactate dehydrogenase (cytochrome) n=1 Tax=Hemiselmis tepida TaxID=464990 RepID=A0A7S0W731_9CRYP|mmetsp:Transcript_6369/g.16322  ORF Transcript_6369/g.16322 Transcript_6369/m.16322 type:complete len:1071 (+) Transcript_6369:85-3297(+)|eukprot:CAMPEP_0174931696 /NCGR_PEP_ID=MMETSP1355-20121228/34558_1 /TAXON_ID=464990 /ORGANISM="Hemiselmis tepida, Strain CCMP443" /LENGTH=1070 /DNA_ID=CAMNT_0016178073 /DNA_START=67 /DNA_END=3279 /DNA_ORIENTATION=-
MKRTIVRTARAAAMRRRTLQSTAKNQQNAQAAKAAPAPTVLQATHISFATQPPKGEAPKPNIDFIINHQPPQHSGAAWLKTKRVQEGPAFGDEALEGGYKTFREDIKAIVPDARVFTDPLRTLAYGTDASFYRLVPKIVVKVHNEEEMIKLVLAARKNKTPITFRAGGTSLSGQAITDSILLKLGHTWRYRKISDDGSKITVEPGWILGQVNRMLAPYARKLGPDPSSIESCWIGGVVANNSSGMCCGVAQNTYHTVSDIRMVLHDGTVLDTHDPASWASFQVSHKSLVDGVMGIAAKVKSDPELVALIKKKFSIKCTTGYSINALVDFDEPKEVIKHLMVGSEGTLGFVSRVTYNTVPDYKDKASAFVIFQSVEDAALATHHLREANCTDAVELFDRPSLYTCENMEYMQHLRGLPPTATALLIECRGEDQGMMQARIDKVVETLKAHRKECITLNDVEFSFDAKECAAFWDARKALIPMVGAVREAGTSVLLEDVAVPVKNLAALCKGIDEMFKKFDYKDGSAFGHALEGNLHLVFTQDFETQEQVDRYAGMMDYLCKMVVNLEGSLKAEHGTGRNVAPYVELEWGKKATGIMWELKALFDPEDQLNPGVVLNTNPNVHKENLKPLPVAHGVVDTCMECGFCESACPSGHVTLTPRQRIVTTREIARLERSEVPEDASKLALMKDLYQYNALDTCAADGMCATKCPVNINTGRLVKDVRAKKYDATTLPYRAAEVSLSSFGAVMGSVPLLLNVVDKFHGALGSTVFGAIAAPFGVLLGVHWNKYVPKGAAPLKEPVPAAAGAPSVVYLATCVSRSMGPARGDSETESIHEKTMSLLGKAGVNVIMPADISNACCGLIYDSRGLPSQGDAQLKRLEASLLEASNGGEIPILADTSPCIMRMKDYFASDKLKAAIYDPTEYAAKHLLPRLDITKQEESVAIHVPCSSKKMKKDHFFEQIARACATEVTISPVPCCGMAGDRGLRFPEMSGGGDASAVAAPPGEAMVLREPGSAGKGGRTWPADVATACSEGFSTSRTCEIALSLQTGTHFKSILYLLDRCSTPKQGAAQV